jgi:hypothetical protein
MQKVSIRFFDDKEVRAIWDDQNSKWWFSVLDIVGVLRGETDYQKNRNYWKYLKSKLKREGNQLGSLTTQFKFTAPDGKRRLVNVLDYDEIISLAKVFPSTHANRFIEWFTFSMDSIDEKSKSKAYALPLWKLLVSLCMAETHRAGYLHNGWSFFDSVVSDYYLNQVLRVDKDKKITSDLAVISIYFFSKQRNILQYLESSYGI